MRRDQGAAAGGRRRTLKGYLLAGAFHGVLLLVPIYGLFVARPTPPPPAVGVRLARSANPVTSEPSPAAHTEVAPALDAALEGAESDAPFQEAKGAALGEAAGDVDAAAFGLDLGAASGRGRGGSGGPSRASEGAVHEGLEWLARHQLRDGSWGPVTSRRRRRSGDCDVTRAKRGAVGHTGLALLCFLAAKQGPRARTPYREHVAAAERWLLSRLTKHGGFDLRPAPPQSIFYQHAIGTLALAEALLHQERPRLRAAVNQLVGFLVRTQNVYGWRYGGSDCDTSVLAWVVLALKAAEHAKVPVPERVWVGPRSWLKRVTTRAGRTGYQKTTARVGEGMTATGLFLRVLLGESVRSRTNRRAADLVGRVEVADSGRRVGNLYAVYYAALAMHQVGGRRWRAFNPRTRDALVKLQDRSEDCRRGSWEGFGWIQGRLLATCFATLTLETYYRYLKTREHDVAYERAEAALRAALKQVDAAAAERPPRPVALRVAERATLRALARLSALDAPWADLGDGRAALVRLAHLQQDDAKAERYVAAYWRALPADADPHPLVVGARRLVQLQGALADFQRAAELAKAALEADSPKVARDARWILAQATTRLKLDLERLRPNLAIRRRIDRLFRWSEETAAALTFHDVDSGIADALQRLARVPPRGRVRPLERRLLGELASRANLQFDIAREDRDAEALRRGAADLAALEARDPARLQRAERAKLEPVLRRARLARVAALLALDRLGPALTAADAFLKDPGALAAQARGLVRTLLTRKFAQGRAKPPEQRRLLRLLAVEADRSPGETLLLARVMAALGDPEPAAALLARAQAELGPDGDPVPFLLARARLALQRGEGVETLRLLAQLPEERQRDLPVTLLRAEVLRAQGQHAQALVIYRDLLRGLRKQPAAWWRVAEEAARTYYRAGEPAAGRRFLKSLRAKDPAFGGRPGLLAMWHRKSWWRSRRERGAPAPLPAPEPDPPEDS